MNASGQAIGVRQHATSTSAHTAVFDFGHRALAAGFVVSSPTGVRVANTVVTPWGSLPSYQLDTDFALAVASPAWRLSSTEQQFSVFKATRVNPEDWLTTPTGHITSIRNASWGDTWVSLTARRSTLLKRSEAYLPGWRATARNDVTGTTVQLHVERVGLIEEVQVPKGTWTIHFHYHAPYIELSVTVSALADALFLVVIAALGLTIWRRRKSKVLA